jgi:hypothetical protein
VAVREAVAAERIADVELDLVLHRANPDVCGRKFKNYSVADERR